jgi:lysophospholipase L1-like esterase
MLVAVLAVPAGSSAATCASTHWVGAWEASPTDASQGTGVGDVLAPSEDFPPGSAGDKKLPVDDSTLRVILTPALGGSTVRVHLSNRFGAGPVTFDRVTIGKQATGAGLADPPVPVTFGGKASVTAASGQDVVSDPIAFSYPAFQNLAVSIYVSGNAGMPTEHYEGRQTSYFTPDGAGDHAADTAGDVFALYNSTRPFVDGVDVLAPASTGAVVAFGDSITDGYQGQAPAGIPANPQGYNENRRWPDDLARRLIGGHIALSVLNAGISGNRELLDGAVGGNTDTYGPSALSRLKQDVLDQSGATTVIWLEGINDIGQSPNATAAQIDAGYVKGIAEMHAAGLSVLQGTLTPAGGDLMSSYGGAAANQVREDVNSWIRTKSPADGVIDFDAAVRDPNNPSQINPAYDGGDHLHFNPTGYEAMADAINVALLRRATCTPPNTQGSAQAGACVDRRGFSFRLHHPRGERIVRAQVLINGRTVRVTHGRRLARLRIGRLPAAGRFTVTIRTLTNRGTRATSSRVYTACTKTRPHNHFRRRRPRS